MFIYYFSANFYSGSRFSNFTNIMRPLNKYLSDTATRRNPTAGLAPFIIGQMSARSEHNVGGHLSDRVFHFYLCIFTYTRLCIGIGTLKLLENRFAMTETINFLLRSAIIIAQKTEITGKIQKTHAQTQLNTERHRTRGESNPRPTLTDRTAFA